MADIDSQFDQAMFDMYQRAKDEAGYSATIFLQMLTENHGRRTAKPLINAPKELRCNRPRVCETCHPPIRL